MIVAPAASQRPWRRCLVVGSASLFLNYSRTALDRLWCDLLVGAAKPSLGVLAAEVGGAGLVRLAGHREGGPGLSPPLQGHERAAADGGLVARTHAAFKRLRKD